MSISFESVADQLIKHRSGEIGVAEVTAWSQQLSAGSSILDLGCGHGIPIAAALATQGHQLFGIDVSPTLIEAYRTNVPNSQSRCESVLESDFFQRKYDAVIAIGLVFLMTEQEQLALFPRLAPALKEEGRLLFTAPWQQCQWDDLLTGELSPSLGMERYRALLAEDALQVQEEFTGTGGNYYYSVYRQQP